MMKKTKDSDLPCHTIDPWGRGGGGLGTVVLGRNSRCHHYRAWSAQWCAGDLYRLFFIGSGSCKPVDTKDDSYWLA
jgi:hypothetical protein